MKSLFLILVGETFFVVNFYEGIFCQGVKMWPKRKKKSITINQQVLIADYFEVLYLQICHFSVSPISIVSEALHK